MIALCMVDPATVVRPTLFGTAVVVLLLGSSCQRAVERGNAAGASTATSDPLAAPLPEQIGDVGEPLAAFRTFVRLRNEGALATDAARALLMDEATEWSKWGKPDDSFVCDKIVRLDADNAVARVTVTTPKRDVNLYYYLRRTGAPATASDWRLRCMRALAPTALLEALRDELEQSPDGNEGTLATLRLTLSSDQQLAKWFLEHRTDLDRLVAAARSTPRHAASKPDPHQTMLDALHVSTVNVDEDGRLVDVVIGGLVDNTVGFVHVRDGAPPPIDSSDRIWVEPLGSGWFLFRTT
jgi:hypothetical protein